MEKLWDPVIMIPLNVRTFRPKISTLFIDVYEADIYKNKHIFGKKHLDFTESRSQNPTTFPCLN